MTQSRDDADEQTPEHLLGFLADVVVSSPPPCFELLLQLLDLLDPISPKSRPRRARGDSSRGMRAAEAGDFVRTNLRES